MTITASTRRRTVVFAGLVIAFVAGALALAIAAQRRGSAPRAVLPGAAPTSGSAGALPVLWQVPRFSFPDQQGTPRSPADLRGHVWVADFVFTQCRTVCPLITAKMALLQRRLRDTNLRFVSFSVDPEHDTPEALKRYAAEWRAGESRWILFSTTPAGLQDLASAMYVSVKPAEDDIVHTTLFFLVDAQGGVRGIYESEKNDAIEQLVRDTQALSGASTAGQLPRDDATSGAELYAALGCGACHARSDLAPPLEGLEGRRVALADGAETSADAAYIRESIVDASAKMVAGYSTLMPSYERELTPSQLDTLVDYVRMFAANGAASPVPSGSAARGAPAELVTDPVCSMKVRAIDASPHASHAGHTYYFCSERCRERFVADPARYLKPEGR